MALCSDRLFLSRYLILKIASRVSLIESVFTNEGAALGQTERTNVVMKKVCVKAHIGRA